MTTEVDPNQAEATDGPPLRPRRKRRRSVGLWTVFGLSIFGILFAAFAIWIIDQRLTAPLWLRERIAERIEPHLGGLSLDFGDVEVVINEGWRPRARLRDVRLTGPDGQLVAQLSDARASLAMTPLMQGQVQPKRISLTGANATIRRAADGSFSLSLEQGTTPVEEASGAPGLVENLQAILTQPIFAALTEIELNGLTLSYEDARSGRIWTADGGQIRLTRDGNDVRISSSVSLLSGRATVANVEANYDSQLGSSEARFGIVVDNMAAQDIASQSVAMAWLEPLDAPISGAMRGSVDAEGALGPLNATLQIGAGVFQPSGGTRPIPFEGAQSYFTFDPAQQLLQFDQLSVTSDWVTGNAEGHAYLSGIETGSLDELLGQFAFQDLRVNPTGTYPEPVAVDQALADLRLELDPFRLTIGQLQVTEGDSTLSLNGMLRAEPQGWQMALDGGLDFITPDRLVALWPVAAAPNPRKWVAENIQAGSLTDVNFALRRAPAERADVYLDFRYQDSTIQFLKTLPPITEATGQANLVDGRLVTTTSAGRIEAPEGGAVDVAGTSFIIPDVGIKERAPGVARIAAAGSITAIMSLLNMPPLAVLRDTTLPVDLAEGRGHAVGTLSLPLADRVTFDEIAFHLDGEIETVSSRVLVPGFELHADRLTIRADQTEVSIAGEGDIDGLPAQVRWTQPIGGTGGPAPSRVTGEVELSPRLVDTFQLGFPPGSVSGEGKADFTITLGGGAPPRLEATSDLVGVGLSIPELGWSKPPGATGSLEVAVTLGPNPEVERVELRAAGLAASGRVRLDETGGLGVAAFDRVRIGSWLDVRADLVGRGAGLSPDIRVRSGRFNLDEARFGESRSGGAPGGLTVALDRLRISEGIELTGFAGEFSLAGGLQGPFRGQVNGQTAVTGEVIPQNGRSAFKITSDDAGGVFRSAGILKQGRGGAMSLILLPGSQPDVLNGTLSVTNARVQDGPAIAALLNAVSLVGLIDELAGQGIFFSEVDARFDLSGERITVYKASAEGPSVGLSMDGTYDLVADRLRMQGAITPAYLINGVGSVLTRRGEGLFGFSYTLRGPAADPSVEVNPLSVLTPGPLREIFREAAPEDPSAPPKRTKRPVSDRPGEDR